MAGPHDGGRSRSENEGLDSFADGLYEIESGDVRDGERDSEGTSGTVRERERVRVRGRQGR